MGGYKKSDLVPTELREKDGNHKEWKASRKLISQINGGYVSTIKRIGEN